MLKKILITFTFAFLTLPIFAEKPFVIAIGSDFSFPTYQNQQDSRCASLVMEYYKSEIATQTKIVLCDFDKFQVAVENMKHKAGTAYTEKEITTLLQTISADYLSLVAITRKDGKALVHITLYGKDGKVMGEPLTCPIDTIRDSDLPAIKLALATSNRIRGKHPADQLSLDRQKQMEIDSEADKKDEGKSNRKRKYIQAATNSNTSSKPLLP